MISFSSISSLAFKRTLNIMILFLFFNGGTVLLTLYYMNYFTILESKCTRQGVWFMQ